MSLCLCEKKCASPTAENEDYTVIWTTLNVRLSVWEKFVVDETILDDHCSDGDCATNLVVMFLFDNLGEYETITTLGVVLESESWRTGESISSAMTCARMRTP